MRLFGVLAALFLLFCAGGSARAGPDAPPTGDWDFQALLDGSPIGQHRFSVSGQGNERTVVSEADLTVKVLGFTAYRYHHKATEQWRGDCLTALDSATDDDGKTSQVREAPSAAEGQGCVMSFAYWNPAICTQRQLLNAQTGQLEAVQVQRVGQGTVEVRGRPVEATEFRITGPKHSIVVWYAADGRWVGLDSIVGGGRKLSYRLQ
jgi:Family of unknown function (DUF6134)